MVRIGLDLFQLVPGKSSAGLHRFATCLIQALEELEDEHEYVLFVNGVNRHLFPSDGRFRQYVIRLPPHRQVWPFRLLWQHVLLPFHAWRLRLDAIHCPFETAPAVLGRPYVLTIMDLVRDVHYPALFPGAASRLKAVYFRNAKRRSARRASAVICPSEDTAAGVTRHYGIDREKITVIPLAAAGLFFTSANGTPDTHSAQPPYILSLVSLSQHKNVQGLVRAFERARKSYRLPHELRIVGMRGTAAGRVERFLNEEISSDLPVRYLGYISEERLISMYRGADLMVYVPFVEGFGLPPLEAMAMGVPVIASDTSSVPEVCGDAALLVPPGDVAVIEDAIGKVLTDPDFAGSLVEAGRRRAREFSWTKVAIETRAIYEQDAASRS